MRCQEAASSDDLDTLERAHAESLVALATRALDARMTVGGKTAPM